jgi:hypothetical protein
MVYADESIKLDFNTCIHIVYSFLLTIIFEILTIQKYKRTNISPRFSGNWLEPVSFQSI